MTTKNTAITYSSIEAKLEALSKTTKTEPTPGACCYCPDPPGLVSTYICPKCNKGTEYDNPTYKNIQRTKQMIKGVMDAGIKIDESGFCRYCKPHRVKPCFVITISYPDREEPLKSRLDPREVDILIQFLNGKAMYKGATDEQTDMKKYLPLLRRVLLGTEK